MAMIMMCACSICRYQACMSLAVRAWLRTAPLLLIELTLEMQLAGGGNTTDTSIMIETMTVREHAEPAPRLAAGMPIMAAEHGYDTVGLPECLRQERVHEEFWLMASMMEDHRHGRERRLEVSQKTSVAKGARRSCTL
mmetsp:Transcript_2516/g.5972  ORF Transcript_2516/g.5972 Transcript_2516/m.5972 type:complete len:138 (+) Transcript_2516:674-1087(+)